MLSSPACAPASLNRCKHHNRHSSTAEKVQAEFSFYTRLKFIKTLFPLSCLKITQTQRRSNQELIVRNTISALITVNYVEIFHLVIMITKSRACIYSRFKASKNSRNQQLFLGFKQHRTVVSWHVLSENNEGQIFSNACAQQKVSRHKLDQTKMRKYDENTHSHQQLHVTCKTSHNITLSSQKLQKPSMTYTKPSGYTSEPRCFCEALVLCSLQF